MVSKFDIRSMKLNEHLTDSFTELREFGGVGSPRWRAQNVLLTSES
jgi:hypothetical protein